MARRKVLVVDDEPMLLRTLQATLEGEGYEVVLASDGETALKRVALEEPDLMLLDVMMPVMDGWSVLERLRDLPKRPRVICLTARTSRRDLVKGWSLGADEYLTKPFDTEELLRVMAEVLRRTPAELDARRREELRRLLGG